jgi:hypothetical protein
VLPSLADRFVRNVLLVADTAVERNPHLFAPAELRLLDLFRVRL